MVVLWDLMGYLTSGKHTENYGQIHHFLMGKSSISTGPWLPVRKL